MQTARKFFLTALFAAGLFQAPLGATLLVYEGFSGYNNTGLTGQTATGTGLTGDWLLRGNVETIVTETGLTFGSLVTSGGAATIHLPTVGGDTDNRISTPSVEMNFGSSVTGNLYSSMLFNFSSVGTSEHNLAKMGVSSSSDLTSRRFGTFPLGQNEPTYRPGVAYAQSPTEAGEGQDLSLDTTYMAISIFTNVGTTLSSENQGVASVYILSEAQFEDFVAEGRDETNLTDRFNNIGSDAGQITAFSTVSASGGNSTFASGNYMGLGSFVDSGTVTGTYDELRWGTSLDSVTVIPEPGTLALVGLSVLALALFRRRR